MIKKMIPSGWIDQNIPEKIIVKADWKKRIGWLGLVLTVVIGAAAGAVGGKYADEGLMKQLDIVFLTNFRMRSDSGALSVFAASFAANFIFLLVVFLAGLSLWGECLVVFVPFLKGYGYGLTMGYAYGTFGLSGILYNLLIVLPGAFIFAFVISAAVRESFSNSLMLVRIFRQKTVSEDPAVCVRRYLLTMIWFLFLSAVTSGVDMLCSIMFSWLFDF